MRHDFHALADGAQLCAATPALAEARQAAVVVEALIRSHHPVSHTAGLVAETAFEREELRREVLQRLAKFGEFGLDAVDLELNDIGVLT